MALNNLLNNKLVINVGKLISNKLHFACKTTTVTTKHNNC